MSFASFDRRLRRIESTVGSDDPRRYFGQPVCEWPDAAIERAIEMGEERLAKLMAECGRGGFER